MGRAHITNIVDGKCPEVKIVAVADVDSKKFDWAITGHGEFTTGDCIKRIGFTFEKEF